MPTVYRKKEELRNGGGGGVSGVFAEMGDDSHRGVVGRDMYVLSGTPGLLHYGHRHDEIRHTRGPGERRF